MKRSRIVMLSSITLGILAIIAGIFATHQLVTPAHAATPPCIQYGAFTRSVAFIEAQKQGYFTAEGMTVCYNQVTSSTQQFTTLLAGGYDLVSTTSDNIVNRYVNSNIPVQIVDGIDQGAGLDLILNKANGINTIADLKGKTVAVDAPNSGYVFALEKILSSNGLTEGTDYTFQLIGGSSLRYSAIVAGKSSTGDPVYATILGTPFSEQAQNVSTLIDTAHFSSYVAPYQGSVLGVTHTYASAHPDNMTDFIKATIRGRRFAANPANQATVVADIASTFNVSTDIATQIYTDSQQSVNGENPDELLNPQALINTINLRQQFGGFTTTVNPNQLVISGPTSLYHDRYWKTAINQLKDEGLY
jgi:ABC-type nitrate/sulfonate/bicarbonate transport system substrate-binding protein